MWNGRRYIFEYDIISLEKRIDVNLLIKKMIFSLHFKNGKTEFVAQDAQQDEDYAIGKLISTKLRNFAVEKEGIKFFAAGKQYVIKDIK